MQLITQHIEISEALRAAPIMASILAILLIGLLMNRYNYIQCAPPLVPDLANPVQVNEVQVNKVKGQILSN